MNSREPLPGLDDLDLDRIAAIWETPDGSFRKLIEVGGLDPKKDFRGGDFRGWPLHGQDVRGIDFSGADLRGTGIERAVRDDTTILTGAALDTPRFLDTSRRPRIVILPPSGHDHPGSDIAASLIEDVTVGICRFRSLSILAPHSAWQMGIAENIDTFVEKFDIDYTIVTVLTTSSFLCRLVRSETKEILWTRSFPFDEDHLPRTRADLTRQVVVSLVDSIERDELTRHDRATEPSPAAYLYYLVGQRLLKTLDLPSIRKARRAFKTALSSSSDFVPAMAGLSRTYQLEWLLMARGEAELLFEAERLAKTAIELDPEDESGYRALGTCALYQGRFDESIEALAQAEQRNPQHADVLAEFGDVLVHASEPGRGLEKITAAITLNPLPPDFYWWTAGAANYYLQRYSEAVECMAHMRDETPACRLIAACWAMLGNKAEAELYVQKARDFHPDFTIAGGLSIPPIRNKNHALQYESGLRKAGFN